jgi:hypothetical protein
MRSNPESASGKKFLVNGDDDDEKDYGIRDCGPSERKARQGQ